MNSMIIATNVIRRILKERNTLVYLILFPILAALLSTALTGGNPAVVGVGMQDDEFISFIESMERYKVVPLEESEINQAIVDERVAAAIALPQDKGAKAQIVAFKDDQLIQELAEITESYLAAVGGQQPTMKKQAFNQELDNLGPRMTLGFFTMLMLLFTGTGLGLLLEDKKQKTFMRMYSAPVRRHEMVLGNLCANAVIGIIQIALYLGLTKYIVGIDWGVSCAELFILCTFFLVSALGLSVGLVGMINDFQKYSAINNIVATVTCLLGGAFFPSEFMSGWLGKVSSFFPQKWVMEAFDKLSRGATLADTRVDLLILVLFGVAFFTFGVSTLKPNAADL